MFVTNSIRQQRKEPFNYPLLNNNKIKVINATMENCYVNGLSIKDDVLKKNINRDLKNNILQEVAGKNYQYIKIEVNNYIGNFN